MNEQVLETLDHNWLSIYDEMDPVAYAALDEQEELLIIEEEENYHE